MTEFRNLIASFLVRCAVKIADSKSEEGKLLLVYAAKWADASIRIIKAGRNQEFEEPMPSDAESFDDVIRRIFGDKIRDDDGFAESMWSALTNIEWYHDDGRSDGHSFRSADDLISEIRRKDDDISWYCCAPAGVVSDEIREAMNAEGWHPFLIGRDLRLQAL